jgi:hypothetical protein
MVPRPRLQKRRPETVIVSTQSVNWDLHVSEAVERVFNVRDPRYVKVHNDPSRTIGYKMRPIIVMRVFDTHYCAVQESPGHEVDSGRAERPQTPSPPLPSLLAHKLGSLSVVPVHFERPFSLGCRCFCSFEIVLAR